MAQSRRTDKAPPAAAAGAGPRILKKYPNRRLYDTEISSYITLADVKAMVLQGTDFEVRDAKSGEDLTRSILLQIILEEETGGVPMFSTSTLAQIIRFYGHAMQGMMGSYLEQNLQTFTDVQARLAEQSKGLYDPKLQSPELWTKFLSGQAGADREAGAAAHRLVAVPRPIGPGKMVSVCLFSCSCICMKMLRDCSR